MADNTKIEWCDASWNPIRARNRETGRVGWFCVHKSPGCKICYAEPINRRLGTGVDYKAQNLSQVEVFLDENMLTLPLRWRKPRVVFPCSMTDLFGEFVPDEMIDAVVQAMIAARQHVFIVLTKRSARMRAYFGRFKPDGQGWITRDGEDGFKARVGFADHRFPAPNVWLGVSCEDQARADERIPDLLATPAAVRLVSAEPLLDAIDLARYLRPRSTQHADGYGGREGPGFTTDFSKLDWVIAGGESGQNARPMHPDWARSLRDQCAVAAVAFFFKQWGQWAPRGCTPGFWLTAEGDLFGPCESSDLRVGPGCVGICRVGKKAAGRMLDGVEHNQRPKLTQELFS